MLGTRQVLKVKYSQTNGWSVMYDIPWGMTTKIGFLKILQRLYLLTWMNSWFGFDGIRLQIDLYCINLLVLFTRTGCMIGFLDILLEYGGWNSTTHNRITNAIRQTCTYWLIYNRWHSYQCFNDSGIYERKKVKYDGGWSNTDSLGLLDNYWDWWKMWVQRIGPFYT